MTEALAQQSVLEYPKIGGNIPILEHFGCSSLQGFVIQLDEKGKPKKAKCLNPKCHATNPTINWAQMKIEMETRSRRPKISHTF